MALLQSFSERGAGMPARREDKKEVEARTRESAYLLHLLGLREKKNISALVQNSRWT